MIEPWRFWIAWAVGGSLMVGTMTGCTLLPAQRAEVERWWGNQRWETSTVDKPKIDNPDRGWRK